MLLAESAVEGQKLRMGYPSPGAVRSFTILKHIGYGAYLTSKCVRELVARIAEHWCVSIW